MSNQMFLVGAGAFGRETLCWLRDAQPNFRITGFMDDAGNTSGGLPWLSSTSEAVIYAEYSFLLTIADPKGRQIVAERQRDRGPLFASLVHPKAAIPSSVKLGEGCIFCPCSVASVDATIGSFVIVNVHSSAGHDLQIGSYSTLNSRVDLTGAIRLGERVSIGSSACILLDVAVGDVASIRAGAVVVRSVPSRSMVYTHPAKRLQ